MNRLWVFSTYNVARQRFLEIVPGSTQVWYSQMIVLDGVDKTYYRVVANEADVRAIEKVKFDWIGFQGKVPAACRALVLRRFKCATVRAHGERTMRDRGWHRINQQQRETA